MRLNNVIKRLPERTFQLRGEYENKIRMGSSLTKIFETFASEVIEGELYMSYFDLLKSICNFDYTTNKTQKLFDVSEDMREDSKIMMFDSDNDNKISVYEV